MHKVHGTESDTESLTKSTNNKYPYSKFEHSLRTKDIFSFYDTKLIRVKPNQGYAIRRVLGEGTNSTRIRIAQQVFIHGLKLIINGVVDREYIFQMPFKNLDVKIKIISLNTSKSKPLLKFCRGRVDPFEIGFQMYDIVLQIDFPKRPRMFISLHVSKHMYDTMIRNKVKGLTYENSKIRDIKYIVEQLEDEYPDLLKSSISSALRHGLNTIFKALIRRCDSYINLDSTNDKFFVYFSGSSNVTQYVKIRKKVRFLMMNKKGKPPHDGTYYFSLTDDNMDLFNQGQTVTSNCTRYLEELIACKKYAKNIFKIQVQDCKHYSFFNEINKEHDNTEYIYRWNDNGFESINNT